MADIPALDALVLLRVRDGQKLDVLSAMVEEGIAFSFTYDAAPTLTLTLNDPDWSYLTSGFFDSEANDKLDAIDWQLEGYWWRLTQVNPDSGRLRLVFEPRDVQRLRFRFGHIVVSRDKSTRAEFIRRLVKSITDGSIGFYSRELHDKQPTARGKGSTKDSKDSKDVGVDPDANYKIKNHRPDHEQRENIGIALREAEKVKATVKATKALLVAGIGESDFRKGAKDGVTGTHKGVWQSNQIPGDDVAGQAHHFLVGGKSFREGGAIQAVKDNPDWSAGKIASYVEVSDASGAFYDKYGKEADAILQAAGANLPTSHEVAVPYQFAVNKDESYYDAIMRLASEVNWRAFLHRGVFYFMDDFQLLRGTPQWTVKCISDSRIVGKPTFEWDHRGKYPQEMSVTAIIDRDHVAPGDVVSVVEAGPANGRWIVSEVSGNWFEQTVNVSLRQPQAPKKEPAHETRSVDEVDDSSAKAAAGVLDKLKQISDKDYDYSWGGGHNADFAPSGPKHGYDCSGYISAGLHAAGLIDRPMTSGELMKVGKPGRGKTFTIYASTHHVFLVFENGAGGQYKRADTSPQGGETQLGPHVRELNRSHSGFTARHFQGY